MPWLVPQFVKREAGRAGLRLHPSRRIGRIARGHHIGNGSRTGARGGIDQPSSLVR